MWRVKERRGDGEERKETSPPPSFIFGSRPIFRPAKTENPVPRRSSFFFCSETTLKRLLRRLRPDGRLISHVNDPKNYAG